MVVLMFFNFATLIGLFLVAFALADVSPAGDGICAASVLPHGYKCEEIEVRLCEV
jgi:hypothetical protein